MLAALRDVDGQPLDLTLTTNASLLEQQGAGRSRTRACGASP
jgi:hypothetical protein